jgi:prephenate dehydrogenase
MEADGMMASTHILPQLISAALLDATINQPGWSDARKIAARPFATAAAASIYHDEAKSLGEAALGNRASVVRTIDAYMESLQRLRDAIENADARSVHEYLENVVKAHEHWLAERTKADWQTVESMESQSFGERLSHMFVGNIMERAKKRK